MNPKLRLNLTVYCVLAWYWLVCLCSIVITLMHFSPYMLHSTQPTRSKKEARTPFTLLSSVKSWAWTQTKVSMWKMSNWLWRDMWWTVTRYSCCKLYRIFFHKVSWDVIILNSIFIYTYCNWHLTGFKFAFQFKPESRLSEKDQFCNKTPTANNKVHVLVYVIPAGTVSHMNNDTVKKIQDIRTEASRLSESTNLYSSLH